MKSIVHAILPLWMMVLCFLSTIFISTGGYSKQGMALDDSAMFVGIVTQLATGNPIDSAALHLGDSITIYSNENGIVSVSVATGYYEVTVIAYGYNTWHKDSVFVAETTIVEVKMTQPIMVVSPHIMYCWICPYDIEDFPISISNFGNGPLHWYASIVPIYKDGFEPWDVIFTFDVFAQSGGSGNGGAEFDGEYFYSTRWNSNLMHQYDKNGNLVKEFTIPGVANIRDMAYNGQYLYGGAAGSEIYCFDPISEILIDVISTSGQYRGIAYDPELDGFWGNNWSGDIICSDRSTGAVLDLIPDVGLGGMYGFAYDDYEGRSLWVFDQGYGAGSPQIIYQIDLTSGSLTGISHDVYSDLPSGIAGGLFITDSYYPGHRNIGGLMQGDPWNDYIFLYELYKIGYWATLDTTEGSTEPGIQSMLTLTVTLEGDWWLGEEHRADVIITSEPATDTAIVHVRAMCIECMVSKGSDLIQINCYPNPCQMYFTIKSSAHLRRIRLINYVGQEVLVMDGGGEEQVTVSTSRLAEGTYVVEITDENGTTMTQKVIIEH